jgi:membrane protease YdiL (CAAX protease family)
MPALADYLFAFLLLVAASVFEYAYFWPRFRAAVSAGRPGARVQGYRRGVIGQWLFAVGAMTIWSFYERPWNAMRLVVPHGWRLGVSTALVAAVAALMAVQLWSVLRLPQDRRVAARPRLGGVTFILPHTAPEARWFMLLSVTAGFCEELLYRGYLVWFFAPWLGVIGGMALVVLVFGVSHAYQGRKGAIRATLAGAVMALIVLATGSLIPAMIVHALIDIGGGIVGYLLLRDVEVGGNGDGNPGVESSRAA